MERMPSIVLLEEAEEDDGGEIETESESDRRLPPPPRMPQCGPAMALDPSTRPPPDYTALVGRPVVQKDMVMPAHYLRDVKCWAVEDVEIVGQPFEERGAMATCDKDTGEVVQSMAFVIMFACNRDAINLRAMLDKETHYSDGIKNSLCRIADDIQQGMGKVPFVWNNMLATMGCNPETNELHNVSQARFDALFHGFYRHWLQRHLDADYRVRAGPSLTEQPYIVCVMHPVFTGSQSDDDDTDDVVVGGADAAAAEDGTTPTGTSGASGEDEAGSIEQADGDGGSRVISHPPPA